MHAALYFSSVSMIRQCQVAGNFVGTKNCVAAEHQFLEYRREQEGKGGSAGDVGHEKIIQN